MKDVSLYVFEIVVVLAVHVYSVLVLSSTIEDVFADLMVWYVILLQQLN